jgi:hypothetical protein
MTTERPRGVVRAHLRKLMAAGAVVGLAAATTRTGAATPTPKPDGGAGDGGRPSGDGGLSAATDLDGGGDAAGDADVDALVPIECPPDRELGSDGRCHGYMVVDPLPPPARGCGCHKEPGMATGPDPEPVE